MEMIEKEKDVSLLKENQIIGPIHLYKSSVLFEGKGNILYCEKDITLKNSKIRFTGNNSLVFLDENKHPFTIEVRTGHDSVFYLGKNNYINKNMYVYATERKNVWIGDGGLFSHGIYFRTADPHPLYDGVSHQRINESASIYVGDHVWIGQNSLVLKNVQIGSGAVIGGHSVVTKGLYTSNVVYAGNPAKKRKDNVFFTRDSVHDFTGSASHKIEKYEGENYLYNLDDTTIPFEQIEKTLSNLKYPLEKIKYINEIKQNSSKNRFCVK